MRMKNRILKTNKALSWLAECEIDYFSGKIAAYNYFYWHRSIWYAFNKIEISKLCIV